MSDDRDMIQTPAEEAEYSEEHREDWDPMAPETTLPDPASDQTANDAEPESENGNGSHEDH